MVQGSVTAGLTSAHPSARLNGLQNIAPGQ